MSKKVSGCGCLLVVVVGIVIGAVVMISRQDTTAPQVSQNQDATISAELSDFKSNDDFTFSLTVRNLSSEQRTVYAVVYGEEMRVSPPRRNAWPFSVYFTPDRSSRGTLSSSAISRNWSSRDEQAKGARIELQPNSEQVLEGALGLGSTSPHDEESAGVSPHIVAEWRRAPGSVRT